MPIRPSQISQDTDNHGTRTHAFPQQLVQHGIANYQLTHSLRELRPTDSSLLGIPSESLTHITSFLSPPSLLSLSRTNKQLHDHIDDDNTWRRAYFCQFLGISPEDDLLSRGGDGGESRMHMVRRTETTWKREFVSRWNLRRRYERSRSAAVAHHPVDSAVADTMHLMPSNLAAPTVPPGLLVTSLQYGVVSRSYPVTGKILRGYFDAAGTLNGMGVGNPNAEFSPDVSKCAITADGGTAKILWGLRNGAVAVTVAAKALDSARVIGGKWTKCIAEQQHVGSVQDAIWAGGSSYYCVTGGADGRVKLWDGKKVTCLWTSERHDFRDPCVRVGINLAHSVIASVMHSGQIFVWTGFEQVFASENPAEDQELSIHEYKMSAPPRAVALPTQGEDAPAREVTALHLHCPSSGIISVITVYRNDTHFYRATVDVRTKSIARASYGDGNTGAIGALEPVFGPADTSFVVVGDQLGCVTVYSWSDVCPDTPAPPIHKFEAHGNGAVSALKWTPTVLVTGSSLGSAEVWDSLDFTHLRSFPSVGFRASERLWDAVSRIIVDKDLVVLSVGTKVSAWLGGPVAGSERKGKHLRMPAKAKSSVAKWQRQVELHKDIADSRRELEDEKTYTRRAYGREREQMSRLNSLGLSEVEALEYVLMLSRDEEETRRRSPPREDEDLFIGEFDDIQIPGSSSRSSPKRGSPRSYPRAMPSSSNAKVQVSPRFRPEPMEAGLSISPINKENSLSGSLSSVSVKDMAQFPLMGSTPTSGTPIRRSVSGSPESVRSAWGNSLRMSKSDGPSPPSASTSVSSSYRRAAAVGPSSPNRQKTLPGGLSMSRVSGAATASRSQSTDAAEDTEAEERLN